MTALIQFIVLKREGKWVVKSKDLIENQIRKDLDIRTESLSARQIGFTHGVRDARAGKIGGHPRLGEMLLHALRATAVNY